MNGASDTLAQSIYAGLVPGLADPVQWTLPLLAFALGWTISRFSQRRVQRPVTESQPIVPAFRAVLPAFEHELDRARRFDRSLAVLTVGLADLQPVAPPSGPPPAPEGIRTASEEAPGAQDHALLRAARQIMFWNIGYALNDLLRDTDVPACDLIGRRYVVLLPEANRNVAALAAARLERGILESTGARLRIGCAVYRDDGLSVGDLVRAAAERGDRGAAPATPSRGLRIAPARVPRASDSRS